jgi:hypothetical protein
VGDRRAIKNYVITVQEGERIANVAKRYIQLVNMLSTENVILAFIYQDKFWNAIDEQKDNLKCTICEAPAKKLRKFSIKHILSKLLKQISQNLIFFVLDPIHDTCSACLIYTFIS